MAKDKSDTAGAPTFFRGEWLKPGSPDYDAALPVWNQRIDGRPAVIARCAGVADVVAAVDRARELGLHIDVRSGRCNTGRSASDGMVVDLSPMRGVQILPERRVARVQGGVRGGDLQIEAAVHGLGAVTGASSASGIGFILGGGFGHMTARFGWGSDNVLGIEMVTAAGEVVVASPDENPDLFWAVPGSTGNFGVVTGLELQLHEVPPLVHAGILTWSLGDLDAGFDALRGSWDWMPDELNLIGLLSGPTSEGPGGLAVFACHVGSAEQARADFERLRSYGSPQGSIDATSLRDLHFVNDELFPPVRSMTDEAPVGAMHDELIDALVGRLREGGGSSGARSVEIFPRRGAPGRPPRYPSAFREGTEDPSWSVFPGCYWEDEAEDELYARWIQETCEVIRGIGPNSDHFHPNSIGTRLEPERVGKIYGDRFGRLRDLKREWDPENLFSGSHNIPPATD